MSVESLIKNAPPGPIAKAIAAHDLAQLRTSAATLTSRFNRDKPIGESHFKVHPDIFQTLVLDMRVGSFGFRSGWILIESDPTVEQHHVTPANEAAEHMARLNSPEALGRMLGLA